MGRRITLGVASAAIPIPQTIEVRENRISSTETNSNLELRPNGSGVVDVTALTASGTMTVETLTNNSATASASFNDVTCTGLAEFNEISEITSTINAASGVVVHNFDNGGIFYHTNIGGSFTANFTNVPTTNNRAMAMVLILNQGGSPVVPSVQIDGSAQSINWAYGVTPSGTASKVEVCTFNLIRTGAGSWVVLGNMTSYG